MLEGEVALGRYIRGVGHFYTEIGRYGWGFYKGKIAWDVTLTYRTGDHTFRVYTKEEDFNHMLRLNEILEILFEEVVVENYSFEGYCDYLGVKRKRKCKLIYEERLKNTGKLYNLLGEDFEDIRRDLLERGV